MHGVTIYSEGWVFEGKRFKFGRKGFCGRGRKFISKFSKMDMMNLDMMNLYDVLDMVWSGCIYGLDMP